MKSRAVPISFALLMTAAISSAEETQVTARLTYFAEATIANCPDAAALRAAVSSQLDYDPFAQHDSPNRFITANIIDQSHNLRATVQAADAAGQVLGSRIIESEHKDCEELASSVALAIAVAIDPLVLVRAKHPAPTDSPPPDDQSDHPTPTPPRSKPPVREDQPAPKPEGNPKDKSPIQALSSFGPFVAVGAEPSTTTGLALSGGLRLRWMSLQVEGSAVLPGTKERADGGKVESFSTMGSLLPCAHRTAFAVCAVLSGGTRHGRSTGIAHPKRQTSLRADVGLRGVAELEVTSWFSAEAHVEAVRTLTKTTLEVDGEPVWTSPSIAGTAGFAAALKF